SAIGLSPTMAKGLLVDFATKNDALTGTLVDIAGTLLPPNPPIVVSVFFVDRDLDGTASQGDRIVVELNEPVKLDRDLAGAKDFALATASDTFGTGATVTQSSPTEVTITLGASPAITTTGMSTAASKLDVSATATKGAIV